MTIDKYRSITLKDQTTLASAYLKESYPGGQRFVVPVYDDSWGELWVFGCEHGVTRVIRCQSFESAWEIAIDESPTISADDVPEAYGFYGTPPVHEDTGETWGHLQADMKDWTEDREHPELIEGYEYQSNMSGTGIVNVGHYSWLREANTLDFQGENRLRIVVTADQ